MAANVAVPTPTFVAGTSIDPTLVNANFAALVAWINANAVHLDGTKATTATLSGPASDPVSANQYARKSYVDAQVALPTTRYACIVQRAANQAIPASTPTAIVWDTEASDPQNMIAVPSSTITIGATGLYATSWTVTNIGSMTAPVAELRINGIGYGFANGGYAIGGGLIPMVGSGLFLMSAGDSVTLMVNQGSGTQNCTATLYVSRVST